MVNPQTVLVSLSRQLRLNFAIHYLNSLQSEHRVETYLAMQDDASFVITYGCPQKK